MLIAPRRAPLWEIAAGPDGSVISAGHAQLGERFIYSEDAVELLLTENETNMQRIANTPNRTSYVKDGINCSRLGGAKPMSSMRASSQPISAPTRRTCSGRRSRA